MLNHTIKDIICHVYKYIYILRDFSWFDIMLPHHKLQTCTIIMPTEFSIKIIAYIDKKYAQLYEKEYNIR